MLASCWLAIVAVATSYAAELLPSDGTAPTVAMPEAWQLVAESNYPDEQLPEIAPPEDDGLSEDALVLDEYTSEPWTWRWVPEGLIYHSYLAGPHEPRMALVTFYEASDDRTVMDATLGGRVGMLQYGNGDPFDPNGFQLDFYGAAIARLDVENQQNLDSTDYVFGLPLTWGDECLQFKCGYAHLSSHLGDEFAINNPGSLAQRVNYVRDAIEFGTSYYIVPAWRTYGEVSWAFHRSGGAEPLAAQFGTELSRPGPTGDSFAPFVAVNARLREEHDFGGDLAIQTGWLRRGLLGQTLRFGFHFYTGKSSQAQFFTTSEQQLGAGIWYDF
jgi:hypothetical protein